MTIEELLEIEEIKKIRSQYSHFYDANSLENLVDLFTDDAVCEWDASHGGCWTGKAQICANYKKYFDEFGNKEWIVMHAITNPWIELTGPDTAEGRYFMLDFNFCGLTEDPLGCIGVYDDAYKKVNGKWKIHRTRLDFLYPDRIITGGTPGHRVACVTDK